MIAVSRITQAFLLHTRNSISTWWKRTSRNQLSCYIAKPVVLLSDGHSSHFDEEILGYLQSEDIHLFLGLPDTTSVTQLLDQINGVLHSSYRTSKNQLFTPFSAINCEGFMEVLSTLWPQWTTKEKIINAARRVGIASNGLDVNWMQQDKFAQAERILTGITTPISSTSKLPASPKNVRKSSSSYWKAKYMALLESTTENATSSKEVVLTAVPGFLDIQTVGKEREKKQ